MAIILSQHKLLIHQCIFRQLLHCHELAEVDLLMDYKLFFEMLLKIEENLENYFLKFFNNFLLHGDKDVVVASSVVLLILRYLLGTASIG